MGLKKSKQSESESQFSLIQEFYWEETDLKETIASWVTEPWIVIRASDASLKIDELSGNLLRRQSASIWHPTSWLSVLIDRALFPPWLEVLDFAGGFGILHPLDNLRHCGEVDVIMVGQDFIDPVEEGVEEFGVVLQPSGVEVKTKWRSVCVIMTLEVVVQECVELVA